MPLTIKVNENIALYSVLKQKVKEALLLGQRQIEEAKVRTYLNTGGLIDQHIIKNASRQEIYGKEVIEKLVKDLEISTSVLWRCLQFARSFKKILARGRESFPKHLVWSHYRKLIALPDENSRLTFMEKAEKGNWTVEELAEKIRLMKAIGRPQPLKGAPIPKLEFTRGRMSVFEVIKDDDNQNQGGLVLDFGFRQTVPLPEGEKYKEGDFIQVANEGKKRFAAKVDIKKEEIYTYKAQVKKIIDGDTLIVRFGVEFGIAVRWKLRLRGIDCPEIDTEEGKRAKRFVESRLKDCEFIVVKTYKDSTDKYDRYLADIFYPPPELRRASLPNGTDPEKVVSQGQYLNQELLDERLAYIW